ncbi:urokinase plasminogen activator surface receptor isoform X2 [Cynoglossus semilaevis]|uniref:urokinase plasminogen activator surface receptor isoform X2 n=1 Tax=Cynoglossus semilaevis TaxID=244447 RepID=UPI0004960670|nr:urokinase plasminogen activator surface receptor isoform X2 [Cynoglossus semilaevis]
MRLLSLMFIYAFFSTDTAFGNTAQQTLKVCASSSLCQVVGTQEFSLNIDFVSAQASISCCNTDNCNQRSPANISGDQAVNGLKCMAINPTQQQTTVECKGKENRCLAAGLSVYSNQYSAYGCVSDNMCQAATLLNELPNLDFVNITREPTCCEIDLCNAPTSLQPSTPHPPTTSNAVYTKQHVTYLLIGHLVLTLLKKL